MEKKPSPKTGIARIAAAFFYSLKGLESGFKEAAFRQETAVFVILCGILAVLPLSLAWKAMLFLSTGAVLVVELLNSAIEAVVDLVSPDFHELAGQAKDMGSAAVLLSIAIAVVLWICALINIITSLCSLFYEPVACMG